MEKLQREAMCVLLQALYDKELITQRTLEKAKTKVLGTLDWPEFFCHSEDDGKEDPDGHT